MSGLTIRLALWRALTRRLVVVIARLFQINDAIVCLMLRWWWLWRWLTPLMNGRLLRRPLVTYRSVPSDHISI